MWMGSLPATYAPVSNYCKRWRGLNSLLHYSLLGGLNMVLLWNLLMPSDEEHLAEQEGNLHVRLESRKQGE